MAYTVKQVAEMAGVSVRTLHFYDAVGLLKPAYYGQNGYRFYEEPQLLTLQQILFYRELGFALKQIKRTLGRADFERVAALRSHRQVLQKNLTRTRTLLATIDKTIKHLEGTTTMKSEEIFAGFSVSAGGDRHGEHISLGGAALNCKVSAKDTGGAMSVFEFAGGWPRHRHRDQDEWVYIIDGEVDFLVDQKHFRAGAGESVFLPRKIPHTWAPVGEGTKAINVYQPAGKMEEFFRAIGQAQDLPTREQVLQNSVTKAQIENLHRLFDAHGLDLLGAGLVVDQASSKL